MKKVLKTFVYGFVLLLVVLSEDAGWSRPVQADEDNYQVYLPVVYQPAWTFLPLLFSDYYSGILPPQYATGAQTGPEGGTVTVTYPFAFSTLN